MRQSAPIPQVDPVDLKQSWSAWKSEVPLGPNTIGINSLAFAIPASTPRVVQENAVSVWKRNLLVAGLFVRGLLQDYQTDDQIRDEVFRAAATVTCLEEDLIEVIALPTFLGRPEADPETIERLKREALADGLDLEKPKMVDRLLTLIRGC